MTDRVNTKPLREKLQYALNNPPLTQDWLWGVNSLLEQWERVTGINGTLKRHFTKLYAIEDFLIAGNVEKCVAAVEVWLESLDEESE